MEILELCAKLKERRKELGYSIEEVVDKTKLYPSVIRDLEEGNLKNLSPAYLKGFIKIYASFLGINVDDLIIEEKKPFLKPKENKKRIDFFRFLKIFKKFKKIIFFILILLILFILILKIPKIFKGVKKDKTIDYKEELKSIEIKKDQKINVAVIAKKNCYLKVKIDGKIFFDGLLKEKTKETWTADKEIEMSISDGSRVYIEVNGKLLPQITSVPKRIKSLKINETGIYVDK